MQIKIALQEVQSKYSTDVAGSPDEIKNLNITVFGKEFQTGQTFQEYYEIFEQKAQEYGYELEENDIDYDMEPGRSINPRIYFEYCYQKRIGIDLVVTNATDEKKPLRQCQIIQISITYDNSDESYNQYKDSYLSNFYIRTIMHQDL